MQNPSQGVAQALQPHVHLISAHPFPISQNLNLETAYRYLIDAPSIVKEIAPMSWHYITAPQDGTMWLEWLQNDPSQMEKPYPSDGYVWGDPEQTFRQEYNGYTVEWKFHRVGYRPGFDQMASRARTRYHFHSNNPNVTAAHPDPSLWIVHYHSSEHSQMMPAAQVPVSQQMQQSIAQRRWLEAQGRLERREFMLHDRGHWPTLNLPGQLQQPPHGAMTGMQGRYPQPAGGQPPQKRVRTSVQSISLPGGSDAVLETSIEIDEDTALGDFFDHLTQRDISIARYSQHHRWMEEVFSSPYASNQIVPADLGLGLMGELKGLTDGILEPPDHALGDRAEKPAKPKEADVFTNLKAEQVEEFGKRVEKHLEEGRAEIERMKAEHAAKMQDWKKVKTLTQAEKRLRYATWAGQEDVVLAYRLEEPVVAPHGEDARNETVEDAVKEVEDLLKVKVTSHEDAHRLRRGGLQDRKQPTITYNDQLDQAALVNGLDELQQQSSTSTPTAGMNGNSMDASTFHKDTAHVAPMSEDPHSKQPDTSLSFAQTGQPVDGSEQTSLTNDGLNLPGIDLDDTLMEGMDIDVGDSNLNFDDATHGLVNDTPNDTPSTDFPPPPNAEAPATADATAAASTVPETGQNTSAIPGVTSQDATQQLLQPEQAKQTAAAAAQSELGGDPLVGGAEDTDLFNNDDKDMFDGLGNIEDGGADALLDFDGGDMTLDDSAFGDAIHGMDEPGGS